MLLQLTKQSTDQEVKAYFEEVLRLARDSKEFPVNLDDVWPLVYAEKGKAVRALKSNNLFVENVDYKPLAQNGKQDGNNGKQVNSWGGNNQVTYMLSVPCLEFFIARKVRPVFEVYRQVFHKVASGELMQPESPAHSKPCSLKTTIEPFVDYTDEVCERWKRLLEVSGNSEIAKEDYEKWIASYYKFCFYCNRLVYMETMEHFEGAHILR